MAEAVKCIHLYVKRKKNLIPIMAIAVLFTANIFRRLYSFISDVLFLSFSRLYNVLPFFLSCIKSEPMLLCLIFMAKLSPNPCIWAKTDHLGGCGLYPVRARNFTFTISSSIVLSNSSLVYLVILLAPVSSGVGLGACLFFPLGRRFAWDNLP